MVVRFGLSGGEIELPAAAGPWRVVLSSHDLSHARTVGSRIDAATAEAIVLQPASGRRIHG